MATRYFNAGNTEATPYGNPMGGGDITPLGGGEGSGLFQNFDFAGQQDLANQRNYAQLEKGMAMEQAKREADQKMLNDAYAKFQLDVTAARNAQELKQQLQGRATQGYEQALKDPLFSSAVAKMNGSRREPMTQQERDSYLYHTQGIRQRQAESQELAQHKAYIDEYDKQRLGPNGENVHTPAFEQTLQGQLPNMEAMRNSGQMYYGRSKDISEHLQKDVRPIIKDFMDQSDEIVGLRRDLSALKPGENAWFHQATKIKSATIEKALQTLSGIWDSDPSLASAKAKGLTKEQYLALAKAVVSQQVDKTLSAEPYKLAEHKAGLDLNNDIAKLHAKKNLETDWEHREENVNGKQVAGYTGNLSKEDLHQRSFAGHLPSTAISLGEPGKYWAMTKLKTMGIPVPSYAESYKMMPIDKDGNFIQPEIFNNMGQQEKSQIRMQQYKVYSMPDPQELLKVLEGNKALMEKFRAGKEDAKQALSTFRKDDETGQWTIKNGEEGTISSSNFMVPLGNPSIPGVGEQRGHIIRGNLNNIGGMETPNNGQEVPKKGTAKTQPSDYSGY